MSTIAHNLTPRRRTTLLKIIGAIRDRLAKGWCQRAFAKNKNGCDVSPSSPTATAWSLIGAIRGTLYPPRLQRPTAAMTNNQTIMALIHTQLTGRKPGKEPMFVAADLMEWNDKYHRTQQHVLDLIDDTLEDIRNTHVHHQSQTRKR